MVDIGVRTTADCIQAFDNLKMSKNVRYLTFKLEGSQIVLDASGDRSSTWETFTKSLPRDNSRFIVYDFHYLSNDKPAREVEKLIFIYWSPEGTSAKEKMLSAAAKGNFRKELSGIARDIQATDLSDLEFDEIKGKL